MAEHTPGPWEADLPKIEGNRATIWTTDHHPIALCIEKADGEMEANARLIAAALDMYEALEALIAEPQLGAPSPETWELVYAAVAKAKGDPVGNLG